MKLTPTQQRIMDLLADGKGHTREELHKCMPDELSSIANLYVHVHHLNRRLKQQGQEVVSRYEDGRYLYRHVQYVKPSSCD